MLRMDLSALSRTELKQLLAAAEGRGQDALVEQLRTELADRASGGAARRPLRPPPAALEDEPAPMVVPDDDLPGLWLDSDAQRPRSAGRWPLGLAAVALLMVSGAAAWGLNGAPGLPVRGPAPSVGPSAAPAPAQTPAPRAMVARVETAIAAPPQAAEPPAPPAPAPPAPAPPAPASSALAPSASAAPRRESQASAALAKMDAPTPARRRLDPCAAPPTPADRLLCNDLGLNLLNHEMREAYGRAMDAGADPVAIRESQAAWRRARDPVSDPRALARLYDRRIGELKAMAAAPPRPDAAGTTLEQQEN